MAALDKFVKQQHVVRHPAMKGTSFTITNVALQSNSDTLTLSRAMTNDVKVFGSAATTVVSSSPTAVSDTVTLTNGTAEDNAWVVSRHTGVINQGG